MPDGQNREVISSIHFNSSTSQLSDLHIILVTFYCQEVMSEQARWMTIAFPLIILQIFLWLPASPDAMSVFMSTQWAAADPFQCPTFPAVFHSSLWWWQMKGIWSAHKWKKAFPSLFSVHYGYTNYKNLERFSVFIHFVILVGMRYLKVSIVNVTLKMF